MLSPNGDDDLRIPVSHGLVLDPWLEPLPSSGPEPDDLSSGHPKLMVINAEGFTLWAEHFKRLEEVVPAWPESALLTISTCLSMKFDDYETCIQLADNIIRSLIFP
jgi:platelet-activating factor acetylhydrolase